VIGAKALLLSEDVHCNTHIGIIQDFDQHFVEPGYFDFDPSFQEVVLQKEAYNEARTHVYLENAEKFVQDVIRFREKQSGSTQKQVIGSYYKA
jgi:sulfite reductase (ferredoxin)